MMTGLTIASGIGRMISVLLRLLFSNEQDLLLQLVLLGTSGWFLSLLPPLAKRNKTSGMGDRLTSHTVTVAPCSGGCCH